MKKFLLLCMALGIYQGVLAEKQVVVNNYGEKIYLDSDGTWILDSRKSEIENLLKVIDIDVTSLNPKKNQYRTMTIEVKNNSNKTLKYMAIGVKFKFGVEYSLRKIIIVRDLEPKKLEKIMRHISVQDIEGRDYKLEIIDYKM